MALTDCSYSLKRNYNNKKQTNMFKFNFPPYKACSSLLKLSFRPGTWAVTIIFVFITVNLTGQEQKWEWIKSFGSTGMDEICSAACDEDGNIYVAGHFQKSMEIDGTVLVSKGDEDIFVAKFDRNGHLQWAKRAGGYYSENLIVTEYAKKIKVDSDGSLIVAGCFTWLAEFEGRSVVGPGNIDIFVAKYSPEGRLFWVKSYGSRSQDFLFDMDVSGENIYLAGRTSGALFEIDSAGSYEIKHDLPISGTCPFLLNIGSNGKTKWVKVEDNYHVTKTFLKATTDGVYYAVYAYKDQEKSRGLKEFDRQNFFFSCFGHNGELVWSNGLEYNVDNVFDTVRRDNTAMLVSLWNGFIHEVSGTDKNLANSKFDGESPFKAVAFTNPKEDRRINLSNERVCFLPGKNLLIEAGTFSSPIKLVDSLVNPDGKWFHSYVTLTGEGTGRQYFIDMFPGAIVSLQPSVGDEYYVVGNYFSGQDLFPLGESGGCTDIFIGKRKLNNLAEDDISHKCGSFLSEEAIRIVPNPASSYCTISASDRADSQIRNIVISDNAGKVLKRIDVGNLPYTINLSGFSSGIYNISLIYLDLNLNFKLCVL